MAKDSIAPAVVLDRLGVRIPWKVLTLIAIVLAGGGFGSLGMQALFGASATAKDLEALDSKNAKEHGIMSVSIEDGQRMTIANTEAIKMVTVTVEKIEAAQVRDIARKEARRLVDDIKNRQVAEYEYDRLFEQNLRRLSRGMDPCGTLACE